MEEKLNIFMAGNKTWPDIQFVWQYMIDVVHDLAEMLNIGNLNSFIVVALLALFMLD